MFCSLVLLPKQWLPYYIIVLPQGIIPPQCIVPFPCIISSQGSLPLQAIVPPQGLQFPSMALMTPLTLHGPFMISFFHLISG